MVNMLILLVGHQLTDLCTNKLCLKHGLYLLGIVFRLTLIWVRFLGVCTGRYRSEINLYLGTFHAVNIDGKVQVWMNEWINENLYLTSNEYKISTGWD